MEQQIDISQTSGVICSACKNNTFVQAFILRKSSRFITVSGQDEVTPFAILTCQRCGTVASDMLHPALKKVMKIEDTTETIQPEPTTPENGKVVQMSTK